MLFLLFYSVDESFPRMASTTIQANDSLRSPVASAAVLLGFIPTILALAGPSTVEIGLLSLRRPFLAVLLGCATPAITSIPTFEHKSPIEVLQKQQDSLVVPKLSKMSAIAITVIEYICACAAIGNVAYTSWQLGISSVCSFAPGTTFLPILWNFLAPVIYLFGVYAVVLRTKFSVCEQDDCEQDDRKDAGMFTQLFRREFQLCSQQPQATLTFQHESYLFVFISMLTSMATVVHLTFGTVVFSSTLFVGTGDAIKIACRYFASTAACQAILMFEINGLRQTVNISEARTDEASYDAVSDGAHSQNCPTKLPGQYLA